MVLASLVSRDRYRPVFSPGEGGDGLPADLPEQMGFVLGDALMHKAAFQMVCRQLKQKIENQGRQKNPGNECQPGKAAHRDGVQYLALQDGIGGIDQPEQQIQAQGCGKAKPVFVIDCVQIWPHVGLLRLFHID